MAHILYTKSDGYNARVICERPNWKTCPEHKHLTNKMPKDFLSKNEETVSQVEASSINPNMFASGFEGEEQAMIGMRQAYNDYRTAERRKKIWTAVAWTAAGSVAGVGLLVGFPWLAFPVVAFAGWKIADRFGN